MPPPGAGPVRPAGARSGPVRREPGPFRALVPAGVLRLAMSLAPPFPSPPSALKAQLAGGATHRSSSDGQPAASSIPGTTYGRTPRPRPSTACPTPPSTATRACSHPPLPWSSPNAARVPATRKTACTFGPATAEARPGASCTSGHHERSSCSSSSSPSTTPGQTMSRPPPTATRSVIHRWPKASRQRRKATEILAGLSPARAPARCLPVAGRSRDVAATVQMSPCW
jgi:hypothetical protein